MSATPYTLKNLPSNPASWGVLFPSALLELPGGCLCSFPRGERRQRQFLIFFCPQLPKTRWRRQSEFCVGPLHFEPIILLMFDPALQRSFFVKILEDFTNNRVKINKNHTQYFLVVHLQLLLNTHINQAFEKTFHLVNQTAKAETQQGAEEIAQNVFVTCYALSITVTFLNCAELPNK